MNVIRGKDSVHITVYIGFLDLPNTKGTCDHRGGNDFPPVPIHNLLGSIEPRQFLGIHRVVEDYRKQCKNRETKNIQKHPIKNNRQNSSKMEDRTAFRQYLEANLIELKPSKSPKEKGLEYLCKAILCFSFEHGDDVLNVALDNQTPFPVPHLRSIARDIFKNYRPKV